MKKYLFLSLLLCSSLIHAQDSGKIIRTDLDGDGKPDTVKLLSNSRLYIQLSSQKQPIIEPEIEGEDDTPSYLRAAHVGFIQSFSGMRWWASLHFAYDKASRQIQLIGMDRESYGTATNDGSGKDSTNLKTGEYIGKWHHYDAQKQKLYTYPTIKTRLNIAPIDLTDVNYESKIGDIWDKIQSIKKARGIDE